MVVDPDVDVTPTSKVLATLQSDPGGSAVILRVDRDPDTNTFTVLLSADATQDCEVAWFVIS